MKKENKVKAEAPVVAEAKVKGRKVNPNSARQIRLAELAAKKEAGELKKGRPVKADSARQIRLAEQAMKKANGGLKRGRPVKEGSARQVKLAAMKAKIESGIPIKRGRPAMPKVEVEKPVKEAKVVKADKVVK